MNKLAVELLTHISYFACTDGGKTGCSLSLVSKHIHYASRPARFYSVSLIKSAAQIELFLQTYQRERRRSTDTIPRVRHLCLSFFGRGITTAPPAPPTPSSKPTSREEFLASQKSRAQFWRTAQFWLDEQYNRVVPELVRIIAPDLETLALIQTQWRCSTAVKCHFPRLRELTLVGGDPTFIPFSTALDDRPLYPALQRLHHVPSLVNRGIDFFLWAKHAPNLTHLRLSRMGAYPEVTVNTLTQIMSPSAPTHVFPHMQEIVIQPLAMPPPSLTDHDSVQRVYNELCDKLREAVNDARFQALLLVPLMVPQDTKHQDLSFGCVIRMEYEWLTRIEGGEGCWDALIGDGPLHGCWSTPMSRW